MIKAIKKVFVCTMAVALVLGSTGLASAATQSPTISITPVKEDNVTAEKTNGVTAKVDTKKDGTAAISKIQKTSKKSITVSSKVTVNGVKYTVTSVDAKAFANCSKATKVSLPATIKKINANAFTGAKKLKTITLSGTKAITVEKGAFKGCDTKKMTIKVSKKMSKKQLKKLKENLKKAGYKGKVVVD